VGSASAKRFTHFPLQKHHLGATKHHFGATAGLSSNVRRYAGNTATRFAVRYVLLDSSAAGVKWIAAVAAAS